MAQEPGALPQRVLTRCKAAFVSAVLDFDTYRASVTDVAEYGHEPTPVDLAEPRQFGDMIVKRRGKNAHVKKAIKTIKKAISLYRKAAKKYPNDADIKARIKEANQLHYAYGKSSPI